MRIAVFIKSTTLHKGFGGLETQNMLLCEGLASRGHDVVVFSPKKELSSSTTQRNNVNYVFIAASFRSFLASQNKDSWLNKSYEVFKKIHSEKPFDIVLAQSSAGIGIIRYKNELGIKVISISHGTALGELTTSFKKINNPKSLLRAFLNTQYFLRQFYGRQREFVLHSNAVVAVSNAIKENLVNETYVDANKVFVINNGVPEESFKSISVDTNTEISENASEDNSVLKILYVGQMLKEKGTDLIKQICTLDLFKNTRLVLIGDGPELLNLKKFVEKNQLSTRLEIRGKLPHDKVSHILQNEHFDVFIFPSFRAEGFPMVLPEAMFAGLPIVAFNVGGVADAVKNNETGVLIPAGNRKMFINKLDQLLMDNKLRKDMGSNAKIVASNEFTLDKMLTKYENLMEKVLK